MGVFMWFIGRVVPVLTTLVLAVLWFVIGGLPFSDHDTYGAVPIRGPAEKAKPTEVALPGGEVFLYYEETGLGSNDGVNQPEDLEVQVRPAGDPKAEPAQVESVSGALFSSQSNDKGWEPTGKVDEPEGDYDFIATSASAFGRLTIGKPPINPFGPPIVGSILILVVGFGAQYLFYLRRQG